MCDITKHKICNLHRIALLMRLDLRTNYRIIAAFTTSLFSILFLYCLAVPSNTGDAPFVANFHPQLYKALLYIGGFYVSSLAFKELHDDTRNYILLTLPCSTFEKFVTKLLISSIGYVAALTTAYFILSGIIATFDWLLFNTRESLFNPLHPSTLPAIVSYLIFQSIFLLGSAYFRKYVMGKIVLTLCVLGIALFAFTSCTMQALLDSHSLFYASYGRLFALLPLPHLAKIAFYLILAPICWTITYVRLTEVEVGA